MGNCLSNTGRNDQLKNRFLILPILPKIPKTLPATSSCSLRDCTSNNTAMLHTRQRIIMQKLCEESPVMCATITHLDYGTSSADNSQRRSHSSAKLSLH